MMSERLSVFTRICQVCDHYDALVAPDPETGHRGLLPTTALRQVIAGSGTRFDPVVVAAFVQVMGRYPVGTVVRLNTMDVGLVISGGRSEEAFDRPVLRLVLGAMGEEMNQELDLAEATEDAMHVVRVLDPIAEGLDLAELVFGDLDEIDELTSMDEQSFHQLMEGTLDEPRKKRMIRPAEENLEESAEIVYEFDVED